MPSLSASLSLPSCIGGRGDCLNRRPPSADQCTTAIASTGQGAVAIIQCPEVGVRVMSSLAVRFSLALILLLSAWVSRSAQAQDICDYFCSKGGASLESTGACFGLAIYIMDQGCGDPAKQSQEPCKTAIKEFQFICPSPGQILTGARGPVCSTQWKRLCKLGGGIPAQPAKQKQPPPKSPGQQSGGPGQGQQSAQPCPPNMSPNPGGRGCVPKLDSVGGDNAPGSTPGAARGAPTSPNAPSATPMTVPASPPAPPAGRR